MDAFEAILGRRSIRKYKQEDVTEDVVRRLLEAAMSALRRAMSSLGILLS